MNGFHASGRSNLLPIELREAIRVFSRGTSLRSCADAMLVIVPFTTPPIAVAEKPSAAARARKSRRLSRPLFHS
jgi:hypothetical protein